MTAVDGRGAPRAVSNLVVLLGLIVLSLLAGPSGAAPVCPPATDDFGTFYRDAAPFEKAIARVADFEPSNVRLSGITVPHHLVADHLVALGFRAASGFAYKRIVVLSPDHFFQAGKMFATTRRGFQTVFGPVATDVDAVGKLLEGHGFIEESCLFGKEHGVAAMLPFLKHYFPSATILPVAISIKAGRRDWDRMADALLPLIDKDTLIVESTDFSHYLPQSVARGFDQQTLNIVASGSLDQIAMLRQPDHADSVGALYIQTKLQNLLFGAAPLVIANENMQQYSSGFVQETTSYLVILFGRFDSAFNSPVTGREHIVYIAGDTLFGRAMAPLLTDELSGKRVEAEILSRTRSRPLVVNLEGVILPNVPEGLDHMTLAMPEDLTIDWLKRLHVVGVGLANNHAMDLGPTGYAETLRALSEAGIAFFGQGEVLELPGLDVVGLTDIGANGSSALNLMTPELLDRLIRPNAERPVVAMVHWGREYDPTPGARETMLSDQMRLRSVSAIVGGHPHVASAGLKAPAGGEMLELYSLGNFLFDQTAGRSSGSMLEVRVFEQGTFFARSIPLPNLFDTATGRAPPQQP